MSLYRIKHEGFVTFVEASCLSRAEEAWLADVRSDPDNADFNEEPDSIELLSIERVVRDGTSPCPIPSGASADTIATVTTHQTPDATPACSTPSDQIRGHSTSSAPPLTEEPQMVTRARWWIKAADKSKMAAWVDPADLLAAYDSERAKLSRIAAILSDDTLENPQKIGRALRVAEALGKGEQS